MVDVLIVGAGPAGSVAATRLARAGARVQLVDRASFPRPKLCGDTVNPGALALVRRAGLVIRESDGLPIDGMVVSGADTRLGEPGSATRCTTIAGRYPRGLGGLSMSRTRFDAQLLAEAVAAGVAFEPGVTVSGPVVVPGRGGTPVVVGARLGARNRELRAAVVIAADGRRSRLATALGLIRQPRRPRRWAIGATFAGIPPFTTGEMHIRGNGYIGLSPLPDGLVNACVVTDDVRRRLSQPAAFLAAALAADPLLRDRVAAARLVSAPMVLGPLAVEPCGADVCGLLTAGDASGFIDPITGDGLRFAIQGGDLAAAAAVRALERGWSGVHAELRRERSRAFAAKWRLNRAIRVLVGAPLAMRAAAAIASAAPWLVERLICAAGDVGVAAALAETAAAPPGRVPAARVTP